MTVSSIATCPNPALLGPTFSPIEKTPIEYSPSFMQNRVLSLTSLATTFSISFGVGIVMGALHVARKLYLANKISSLNFPIGSNGEFLRDNAVEIVRSAGLWQALTSQFPQRSYVVLTAPILQNMMNQAFSTLELTTDLLDSTYNQAIHTLFELSLSYIEEQNTIF